MKSTFPWLIAAVTGCVMIGAFFVPAVRDWRDAAGTWFEILAAIAFVIGGANLFARHLQKISARRAGWGYSAVTLTAFVVTLTVGLLKVGVPGNDLEHPWSGHHQSEGSALWWLFWYVYRPMAATMFALLAFYVASAAFRAFRAKNGRGVQTQFSANRFACHREWGRHQGRIGARFLGGVFRNQ